MHICVSACVRVGTTVFSRYLRVMERSETAVHGAGQHPHTHMSWCTHCLTCSLLAPAVTDAASGPDMPWIRASSGSRLQTIFHRHLRTRACAIRTQRKEQARCTLDARSPQRATACASAAADPRTQPTACAWLTSVGVVISGNRVHGQQCTRGNSHQALPPLAAGTSCP